VIRHLEVVARSVAFERRRPRPLILRSPRLARSPMSSVSASCAPSRASDLAARSSASRCLAVFFNPSRLEIEIRRQARASQTFFPWYPATAILGQEGRVRWRLEAVQPFTRSAGRQLDPGPTASLQCAKHASLPAMVWSKKNRLQVAISEISP